MQGSPFPHARMRAAPSTANPAHRRGRTATSRPRQDKLSLYLGDMHWARAPPDSRGNMSARADFPSFFSSEDDQNKVDLSQFVSRTNIADESEADGQKPSISFVKTRHLKGISEASRSVKRDLMGKGAAAQTGRFSLGDSYRSLGTGVKALQYPGRSGLDWDMTSLDSWKSNSGAVTERTLSTGKETFPFRRFGIKSNEEVWNLREVLHAEDSHKLVSQLAVAILRNPQLRDLDVRFNHLDATAGVVLATALKRHGKIKTVSEIPLGDLREDRIDSVSTNGKGLAGGEAVILSVFLLDNTSLTSVDLSTMDIRRESMEALAYGLRGLTQLNSLNLSSTGMRPEDMNGMCQALRSYRQLNRLMLGTNMLDAFAIQSLARVLQQNRDLRTLVLRNNLIGPAGMQWLSKTFGCLQHLIELDVGNNAIGSEGMKLAGSEWGHLRSLQTLNLSFNNIQPDGVLHLVGELKSLRALHSVHFNTELHVDAVRNHSALDLRTMGLRSLEAFLLAALMRENVMISMLDLRGNNLGLHSGLAAYEEVAETILCLPRLKLLNDTEFFAHDHDLQSVCRLLRDGDQQWMSELVPFPTPASDEGGANDVLPQLSSRQQFASSANVASAKLPCVPRASSEPPAAADSSRQLPGIEASDEGADARGKQSGRGTNGPSLEALAVSDQNSSLEDAGAAKSAQHTMLDSCDDLRARFLGRSGSEGVDGHISSDSSDPDSSAQRSPRTPYFRPGRSTRLRKPASSPHARRPIKGDARRSGRGAGVATAAEPFANRRRVGISGQEAFISSSDIAELSKLLQEQAAHAPERGSSRTPERERAAPAASADGHSGGAKTQQRQSKGFTRTSSTVGLASVTRTGSVVAGARGGSPPAAMLRQDRASPAGRPANRRSGKLAGERGAAAAVHSEGQESAVGEWDDKAWNLSGQRLGSAGAKALAGRVVEERGRVALVDLSLNNITGLDEHAAGKLELSGFKALCAALARSSRISQLNLAWNSLGADAMALLKPVIRSHSCLTKLDLYKNCLQAEGMVLLGEAIRSLPGLLDLDIRYNRIGQKGAAVLADTLPELTSLRRLDAAHNSMGAEGLEDVAQVLPGLPHLSVIDLRDNEGGTEGNEALLRLVVNMGQQLQSVNCLSLERLLEDQSDVAQLKRMLPHNLHNYEALFFATLLQRADPAATDRLNLIYHHSKSALASLNLSSCQLEEFPQALLQLTALEELDISDNSISQVPAEELCALRYLRSFGCKGNPHLYTPPPEVANQGGKPALAYLRQVVRTGEPDDEMALILIGPSEGGKSSCIKALRNNAEIHKWTPPGSTYVRRVNMRRVSVFAGGRRASVFGRASSGDRRAGSGEHPGKAQARQPKVAGIVTGVMGISRTSSVESNPELKEELARQEAEADADQETAVVDMSQWRVSEQMKFSVYDLPGQKLYTRSNMLFLKHRALYLFVWRVRSFASEEAYLKGMRELSENIRGWLETLQCTVRGAAILMVATHIDVATAPDISRQCDIVRRIVNKTMESMDQRKYGCSLHAFKNGTSIPVSCTTGDGLRELYDDIYKFTNAMDSFHARYPRRYLQLRNELHHVREMKPWVPWKEYERLAGKCGIVGEELQTATALLHQLGHLWYFGDMETAATSTLKHLNEDLVLGTVIVSVKWMVDCIRGLLRQDRSMLLGWFGGDHGREHYDEVMVKKVMDLMAKGRIDTVLLPFLWPRQEASWSFWEKAQQTQERKLWNREVIGDAHDCSRVVKLLKGLGLLAERGAEGGLIVPTLVNGSHSRNIDCRVLSVEESNLVGKRVYAGLPQGFFELVVLRLLDSGDVVHFNNFAAGVYRFGMKGQLLLAATPKSPEKTLTVAASHRVLWEELHRKVLMVEKHFPGLCVLSDSPPAHPEGDAAHITMVHSLYAMTHSEAIADALHRADKRLIIRQQELLQFRKALLALSTKARDGLHKASVDSMRKLLEFAFTNDGALAHARLHRAGVPEQDRQLLDDLLNGPNRPCRMAVLCLDSLAQSAEDTDLGRVMNFASTSTPILLVLLPGAVLRTELLPPRWALPLIGIVDLRDPKLWRQERHSWALSDGPSVAKLLQRPIRTILDSWRGLPPKGADFSLERESIVCRECVREQQLIPYAWRRSACESSMKAALKAQVASLDLREDPAVLCGSEHHFSLLSLLVQPTDHVGIPCPNCLELGFSPPFCFSRKKCIAAIEPDRTERRPRGKAQLDLECPRCLGAAVATKEGKSAHKETAKAEPKPLDLSKVLQAEVFVSFARPQTSCAACAENIQQAQEAHAAALRGGVQNVGRTNSTNKRIDDADGYQTLGRCPQCVEGIHKRETVLQLMQRVEKATGVHCVKRTAQPILQPLSRKANSRLLKQATVFVALIDKDYVHSASCCAEFAHAVSASIYILPVILPGYPAKPDSKNWWPADAKVKDEDGAWVAVPWSMMENFPPIHLTSFHDKKKLKAAEQHLMRVLMTRLYRGEYADHSTLKLYDEWKKAKSALLAGLGDLATMSLDELDEVVMKLFKDLDKDRSGSIDLREMQHGLAGLGVRLSDEEAASMMREADVDLSMQLDPGEFRKVVFALMASSTVRMMQERSRLSQ